jgi:hypothetical protein
MHSQPGRRQQLSKSTSSVAAQQRDKPASAGPSTNDEQQPHSILANAVHCVKMARHVHIQQPATATEHSVLLQQCNARCQRFVANLHCSTALYSYRARLVGQQALHAGLLPPAAAAAVAAFFCIAC